MHLTAVVASVVRLTSTRCGVSVLLTIRQGTCIAFRGRYVRGDYALLLLVVAFTALYGYLLRTSSPDRVAPFVVAVRYFAVYALTTTLITIVYRLSPWHPLASYPGPPLAKLTSLWLSYISSTGKRFDIIDKLHQEYGPFLRIGKGNAT